jgi:methylated-DNA-[protein]-cysteine S-methyltransferase
MTGPDLRDLAPADDSARRAAALSSAVRAAAEAEGLVDVAVAAIDSPVGELLLAVTGRGLAYVAFEGEDREVLLRRFARSLSPRVVHSAGGTDEVRRELDAYFAGTRRVFELPLDRRLMTPFARSVLDATARVGYGELATYGQIANAIGRPSAARAVGAALGSNPIPIVVPCHRIVGASGTLTGYAGGIHRKELLLELEGSLTG